MDKIIFLKLLGENIIRLRSKKNWSQSDLARECGKDRQSIERLENGKINPSAYYLKQIAESLNIPLNQIFDF